MTTPSDGAAWACYHPNGEYPHPEVIPINDVVPHEFGFECACGPILKEGVLVHYSLDGREHHEPDGPVT
ncbi:hypothetical protein [Zhihengliuella flava]|uniref:Uncharacterized protein n=1 Tax=Zhihengliuella flava TaxID=1285193 RepID=A0A931D6F5_9MICC|nr:hypothetical protein [Zhihengliuella flava]MBG6083257.1 hypothetical protein [Zhihengliuella flava]